MNNTLFSHTREKILSLKELIGNFGVRRFLKLLLYSYHEEIIVAKDLLEKTSSNFKDRLQVECVRREQLEDLVSLSEGTRVEGPDYLKVLNRYLDNNCNGLIAKLNGEVIGYMWWWDNKVKPNFSDIRNKFYSNEIKLGPKEAYGFDFYVSRKHRGYGIPAEFLIKAFDMGRSLGYERIFSSRLSTNLAVRWVHRITGYKAIGKVKVRRFFLFLVLRNNKLFIDRDWRLKIWYEKW